MDCGNLARLGSFCTDKAFPANCQQTSGKAYPAVGGTKFDRGHLVPANHFDHDAVAIVS
jgi:endonuclease G